MRKVLFQIHLWTGLILGTVFVLLGLSGSVLVYDHEIMALGDKPVPRAQAAGAPLPFDRILAAARAAVPDKRLSATIAPSHQAGSAAMVRLQSGGRGGPQVTTDVYVDPASGRILEVRRSVPHPVLAFLHQFHGSLSLGRDGRSIVGWLGFGMLMLGLSGIVLWWPKRTAWKYAFGVRKDARGYWLHRDLHGAAGIWGWIVFVIVSFSGIVIAFPDTARMVTGSPSAAFDPRRGPVIEPLPGRPLGADAAVALVLARYPGAQLGSVTMPARRSEAIRVQLGSPDDGPVAVAFVDPWRRTIVATRNPPDDRRERFLAWQRPLHAGNGLGPLWRALVFLSGLLPAVFFTTGLVMWLKKRKARL
jgi:uncharacterized iron-regulated membrane protein